MQPHLPAPLRRSLTAARDWWPTLADAVQDELLDAWDLTREGLDWSLIDRPDPDGRWQRLPLMLEGVRLPGGAALDADEEWVAAAEAYLDGHRAAPLRVFFEAYTEQPAFRMCRAHPAARACLRRGIVPASFRCPLRRSACPGERLVARAGGTVQLRLGRSHSLPFQSLATRLGPASFSVLGFGPRERTRGLASRPGERRAALRLVLGEVASVEAALDRRRQSAACAQEFAAAQLEVVPISASHRVGDRRGMAQKRPAGVGFLGPVGELGLNRSVEAPRLS